MEVAPGCAWQSTLAERALGSDGRRADPDWDVFCWSSQPTADLDGVAIRRHGRFRAGRLRHRWTAPNYLEPIEELEQDEE